MYFQNILRTKEMRSDHFYKAFPFLSTKRPLNYHDNQP